MAASENITSGFPRMVKFVSPEKRAQWLTQLERRFNNCA